MKLFKRAPAPVELSTPKRIFCLPPFAAPAAPTIDGYQGVFSHAVPMSDVREGTEFIIEFAIARGGPSDAPISIIPAVRAIDENKSIAMPEFGVTLQVRYRAVVGTGGVLIAWHDSWVWERDYTCYPLGDDDINLAFGVAGADDMGVALVGVTIDMIY